MEPTSIHPHLEFAVQTWSPYLKKKKKKKKKILYNVRKGTEESYQTHASIKHLSYRERLRETKLYNLEQEN